MTKQPVPKNPTYYPTPRAGQVTHVHILKNGMLSAFDADGNDLTVLGGPSEDVLPVILRTCNPKVTRD